MCVIIHISSYGFTPLKKKIVCSQFLMVALIIYFFLDPTAYIMGALLILVTITIFFVMADYEQLIYIKVRFPLYNNANNIILVLLLILELILILSF
jgi:hypothetical protein